MKTAFSRRGSLLMPTYQQNTLIRLILALLVGYILLYSMYVIVLVLSAESLNKVIMERFILPYVALQPFSETLSHPWVLLTYFWGHTSFFSLLSNMLWLYCFGSVIQGLVGKKEIIPLYVISSLLAGLLFFCISYFFPSISGSQLITGASAAIMAFAIGAITLVPKFKFYINENLTIPIGVVVSAYLLLHLITIIPSGNYTLLLLSILGGGIGFLYIKIMQRYVKIGHYIYQRLIKIHNKILPSDKIGDNIKEKKSPRPLSPNTISEEYVDKILDKINQKGYDSLSQEEKDTLLRASQK